MKILLIFSERLSRLTADEGCGVVTWSIIILGQHWMFSADLVFLRSWVSTSRLLGCFSSSVLEVLSSLGSTPPLCWTGNSKKYFLMIPISIVRMVTDYIQTCQQPMQWTLNISCCLATLTFSNKHNLTFNRGNLNCYQLREISSLVSKVIV